MEVTPSARPDWVRSVADAAPGPFGFDPSRVGLGSIRRRRVGGVAVWVRSVADVGFVRSGAGPRGIGCVPRRAMASLSPGAEGPRLGSIRRGAGAGRGAGRLGSIRRGPVSDLDAGSASFPSRRRAGPPGGRWGSMVAGSSTSSARRARRRRGAGRSGHIPYGSRSANTLSRRDGRFSRGPGSSIFVGQAGACPTFERRREVRRRRAGRRGRAWRRTRPRPWRRSRPGSGRRRRIRRRPSGRGCRGG